ncbi:hypothetical protein QTO34_010938 [Cnephaeus nilssonii]|uniref:Butyrophilin subfamily 3 member A3 n=1 Tax=Cnephaeus nilssonii TaxID=3371016 RepID=A0AA40HCP5_CNENI|nr:hypothetical protein QTO34_010938 [Eptesicus nilssonii]
MMLSSSVHAAANDQRLTCNEDPRSAFVLWFSAESANSQFAVIGPPEPILAMVGDVAELPCHLFPKMSAETMELMWVRYGLRQVVRAYADGKEGTEMAEYRGRTSISREDIAEGKAALRIHNVRVSDSGTYQCHFQDGDFLAKALVELKVAALGSDLHVEMKGYEDGGIRVECTSAGWYPQPHVEWRGDEGESLPAMAAPGAVDGEGLYAATSSVILKGGSGKGVSCVIRNPLLSQEKTARVSIADRVFSITKPWQVAVGVTILVLLGLLVGAAFSWWRQQKRIQALRQWERSAKGRRKEQYLASDVILDPDTAHPKLLISEDQRSLNWAGIRKRLPDNPRRFQESACVLGRETFTSGRHFWEVEVGDRKQWHLGVCRENVERKKCVKITAQNGFWTIGLFKGHDFYARTDPWSKIRMAKPPKKVGVFLDYERREVLFYNAINGIHIFTFSQASFSGPLSPVFRVFKREPTALTICPALKGVGSSPVSDPLPGPSLETSVASGSADGNEDPQEDQRLSCNEDLSGALFCGFQLGVPRVVISTYSFWCLPVCTTAHNGEVPGLPSAPPPCLPRLGPATHALLSSVCCDWTPEPILAMVGEDTELPCHLSPMMSAETMDLMWVRSGLRQAVRAYADGKEETEMAEYRGRTSILREDIAEGKAVLRIQNVRASDSGTYQCYFQDGDFFDNGLVELKVAALGSDFHVEMKDDKDGGIRVECTSAGWYPQPHVEWRGDGGETLPAMAAPGAVDGEGLYAATSSVILKGSSGKVVSCVVRNPLLSQEKTARVSIAEKLQDELSWTKKLCRAREYLDPI